jgi:hypothetical protein
MLAVPWITFLLDFSAITQNKTPIAPSNLLHKKFGITFFFLALLVLLVVVSQVTVTCTHTIIQPKIISQIEITTHQ